MATEVLGVSMEIWVAIAVVLLVLLVLMMQGVLGNRMVVAVKSGMDGVNPKGYFNTVLTGVTASQSSPGAFPYSSTSGFEQPSFWSSAGSELNDNQQASVLTTSDGQPEGMKVGRVKDGFKEDALATIAYGNH